MTTRHHLPHLVTVQSRPATKDAFGQRVDAPWANEYLQIRAHVEPLSGRALVEAQAHRAESTWAVRIHYRDALQGAPGVDRRVQWAGRTLDVLVAMPDDDRRQYLRLLCSQGLHQR